MSWARHWNVYANTYDAQWTRCWNWDAKYREGNPLARLHSYVHTQQTTSGTKMGMVLLIHVKYTRTMFFLSTPDLLNRGYQVSTLWMSMIYVLSLCINPRGFIWNALSTQLMPCVTYYYIWLKKLLITFILKLHGTFLYWLMGMLQSDPWKYEQQIRQSVWLTRRQSI